MNTGESKSTTRRPTAPPAVHCWREGPHRAAEGQPQREPTRQARRGGQGVPPGARTPPSAKDGWESPTTRCRGPRPADYQRGAMASAEVSVVDPHTRRSLRGAPRQQPQRWSGMVDVTGARNRRRTRPGLGSTRSPLAGCARPRHGSGELLSGTATPVSKSTPRTSLRRQRPRPSGCTRWSGANVVLLV
jgi:hypothetical protein